MVATHDHRMLPLADQVVELVPQFASTDRAPETVLLTAGSVLFEQGTMGDLIYVVADGELEIVRQARGRRRRAAHGVVGGRLLRRDRPVHPLASMWALAAASMRLAGQPQPLRAAPSDQPRVRDGRPNTPGTALAASRCNARRNRNTASPCRCNRRRTTGSLASSSRRIADTGPS